MTCEWRERGEECEDNACTECGCEGCSLPEGCFSCRRFVCNACERVLRLDHGGADDASALCDECWARLIAPWHTEQRRLELNHALQLALVTARGFDTCMAAVRMCDGDREAALEVVLAHAAGLSC